MHQNRGVPWIGFQEAQKAIDALKEEVNLAEKKLSNAKRSLKYDRALPTSVPLKKLSPEERNTKLEVPHFHKETIHKELHKSIKRHKTTVPKTIYLNEHPKHAPPPVPSKPSVLKDTSLKAVYESALTKITSSETSNSLYDFKDENISSEVSSFMGDTYKNVDAELSLKISRLDNIENKDPSEISFNSWEKEYLKRINSSDGEAMDTTLSPHTEDADVFWTHFHDKDKLAEKGAKPRITISEQLLNQGVSKPENIYNDIKWRPVTSGEKFPTSKPNKRSNNYLAVKHIIERQKRFHEEIQSKSDAEFHSASATDPHTKTQDSEVVTSADIQAELQMKPLPLRKKRIVSTLPHYKGFSIPGFSPISNRSRPIKKATRYISEIKRTDSLDKDFKNDNPKNPTFAVKEIVIENKTPKSKSIAVDVSEKEKPFPDSSSSEKSSNSSEPPIQKINDHLPEGIIKTPEKDVSIKSDSSSNELSDEKFNTSSEIPEKSGAFSDKASSQRAIVKAPIFSKSTKRKAGKMPVEKTAPSPKIRHYDVNEVRDYIKKKKAETKKRHQEEREKCVEEVQRKKESLQRLFEFQKAASNPVLKSPLNASKPFEGMKCITSKRLFTDTESSSKHLTESKSPGKTIKSSEKIVKTNAEREFSHPSNLSLKKHVPKISSESVKSDCKKANRESISIDDTKDSAPSVQKTEGLQTHVKKNSKPEEEKAPIEQAMNKLYKNEFDLKFTISKNQETQTGQSKSNSFSLGTQDRTSNTQVPPLSSNNQSMPSFISTISTPSQLSLSSNINAELPEELKFTKFTLPSIAGKLEQAESLKNLVQSINHLTAPYEHIMRTKAWIEQSPPPPPKRKSAPKIKDIPSKMGSGDGKDSNDFAITVAKSLYCTEGTSFKQQVTNVGDTNELFQKIFGAQSHQKSKLPTSPIKDRDHQASDDALSLIEGPLDLGDANLTEKYPDTLDEFSVIEGSLKSEDTTIWSGKGKSLIHHQHASLLDENVFTTPSKIPDPFNFINTWNRKPLGFQDILSEKETQLTNQPQSSSVPPKSESDENKNYSNESFYSTAQSSSEVESSSNKTVEQSRQDSNIGSRSTVDDNSISGDFSQNTKVDGFVSKASVVSSHFGSRHGSNDKDKNDSKNQYIHAEKKIPSLSESSVSEAVSVIENSKSRSKTSLFSNTVEKLQEISEQKSSKSMLDIGASYNHESSDVDSVKENDKMEYEIADSKSSESIPDLSGLVEEGELSSDESKSVIITQNNSDVQENLNLNKNKTSAIPTVSSKNLPEMIEDFNPNESHELSNKDDGSTLTGVSSEKEIVHKNITTEEMRMGSISEISSIDLAKPLQLTFSNGDLIKSLKIHKSISLHNEQYLHTQVVTRVASEAAAAAATSAVIAVFETQKELLNRERHPPSTSTFVSSSQSSPQFETLSDKATNSSASTPKKSSPTASEEITEDINDNESLPNTVKETLDPVKASTSIKSVPLHSSKSKAKSIRKLSRKTSGNISSPSPASLSENESSSHSHQMMASSVASSSLLDESILSDDSFTKLTLEVVREKTREEELRASHKLEYLKFQEKTLVEHARFEMALFESLKKKLKEKGSIKKASLIKKKQKELILRLRQERAQLRCMQEAYRSMSEKCQFLDTPSLVSLSSKRKEKSLDSKNTSESKIEDLSRAESTSTIINADDDTKTIDEEFPDTILEVPKSVASVSSQGSVETILSEQAKSSLSTHSKSPNILPQSFSSLKQGNNQSNVSLNSINLAESGVQGFKKLESSKRHLTKREQRIIQRRKQVERLLQWQMKLDSEEMAVRELEQKAVELVDYSKKKTKYYVSTSPSSVQNEIEKQSVAESPEIGSKISESLKSGTSTDRTPSSAVSEAITESVPTDSVPEENSIPATSGNSVEEIISNIGSNDPESSAVSTSSIKEMESNTNESPIKTAEENTESSNAEEVNTNGGSYPSLKSVDQKSPSSDVYSESFESTASPKLSNNCSTTIKTPPSSGSKREKSFSIKSPLGPRTLRKHDSSGSDDSYTISHSETASDQSDIEGRIHALSEELRRRKYEADRLKREQKRKYREHLKGKELSLQKQVEAYNQYIQQVKLDLERIEAVSSVPLVETSPVKPQIKGPRSEHTGDSRRIRKKSSVSTELFSEKKSEGVHSTPDSVESPIDISHKKEKILLKNIFPETKEKPNFQAESISEVEKPLLKKDSSSSSSIISSNVPTTTSDKEIPELSENIDTETLQKETKSSFEKTPSEIESVKSKEETEFEESFGTPLSSIDTVSSVNENGENHLESSRRKSSGQSDSFVSESSTSQRSENLTVHKPMVHTVASDDIESTVNSLELVEEMQDSEASINTALNESAHSSEPEYTPESSLITNTGSVKDDFGSGDFESSDHSSNSVQPKTNESVTVESLSKEPTSDAIKKLTSESSLVAVPEEKPLSKKQTEKQALQEKLKSETFVVNVVNYICSSVFDDAIKTMLSLSRKDKRGGKLKLFKPSEAQDNSSAQHKSSRFKGKLDYKLADRISNSLLDSYLDEAICSVINIANSFQKHLPLDNKDSDNLNLKSVSDTSSFDAKCDSDFSVNYSIVASHDKNDNIFSKQADWFDDGVLEKQWDSQQLILQHYPYFYRKIPNKPPPPYTPPSSASVSTVLPLPLRKEKPVERFDTIDYVTRNIKMVVEHITNTLLSEKEKGVNISEVTEPDLNSVVEQLGLTVPCQLTFLDLIFDLSKETSLKLFCETEEIVEPWLKPRKLTPKPLFPKEKNRLSSLLYKELNHSLKLHPKDTSLNRWKKPSWSTMKLGRKKRDFVDTILISELKEEEPEWVNYDQEEVTVKFQIADYVFDILVEDAVSLIQNLDQTIFK